ncbi:glycoside hydrolase clan GH-D [Candidatus Colimorpha enterica]|uniref:Alpha-galactosidase n=1 Tax=Candidatus Colimorpha enterica TaxID=3083063 RepID=R6TXI8_9BACT|nr:glycoside hydrolase clan GH-D [Candidatus Colimorpha enterica]
MPIHYQEECRCFHLSTPGSSYLISVEQEGYLLHQYYGKRINDNITYRSQRRWHSSFHAQNPHMASDFSTDTAPMEYGTFGCGDLRVPALRVTNSDGNSCTDLRFVGFRIYPSKICPKSFPTLYLEEDNQADTLEIDMLDSLTGLKVTLFYTVFRDHDVIARRVEIKNNSAFSLWLENVKSLCLSFPTCDYDMIHLYGFWGKERMVERTPLVHGIQSISSNRGVSGHLHNPFVALAKQNATEESGDVYGFSLIWSGDFAIHSETDADDGFRLVMGLAEESFSWELHPEECFQSPEAVMTYSDSGIGDMSRKLHRLFHQHLIAPNRKGLKNPLLINSWEAAYFDFDEEKLYSFALRAKEMGIEMLVMDDGWFGRRNNDRSSLGDWTVNENKLRHGLPELVNQIHALGLKFGIWFEPEMISPDSDLFRSHPDWCLNAPGREPSNCRNQFILDISRPEVRDNIWEQMDKILSSCLIDYVKWDFNRNFSEAASRGLDAAHQKELNYRFTLGTYDLQNRLISKYPQILLENCAGGGGRFDPAMLFFSPQIWCSDNTDPLDRLFIQFGTSLAYPCSTMGAHVSASTRAGLETKGIVAGWGTHGYELDPNRYTDAERDVVKQQVKNYHRFYDLTHTGDLYRLVSPFDNRHFCAWAFVSPDKSEALVTIVNLYPSMKDNRFLYLRGLNPQKKYGCEAISAPSLPSAKGPAGLALYGSTWMNAGINLTCASQETGVALQFYLKEIQT